jgi:hypothetical protein
LLSTFQIFDARRRDRASAAPATRRQWLAARQAISASAFVQDDMQKVREGLLFKVKEGRGSMSNSCVRPGTAIPDPERCNLDDRYSKGGAGGGAKRAAG